MFRYAGFTLRRLRRRCYAAYIYATYATPPAFFFTFADDRESRVTLLRLLDVAFIFAAAAIIYADYDYVAASALPRCRR